VGSVFQGSCCCLLDLLSLKVSKGSATGGKLEVPMRAQAWLLHIYSRQLALVGDGSPHGKCSFSLLITVAQGLRRHSVVQRVHVPPRSIRSTQNWPVMQPAAGLADDEGFAHLRPGAPRLTSTKSFSRG
jgi:hypothetical protein